MIQSILKFSVDNRFLVVVLTLAAAAFGGYSLSRLPIDAVPDITNNQVQINTESAALGPEQIEKQVTFPVETALAGIEGLDYTRSIQPQRLLAGDGRVRGRCRHLLRPLAGAGAPHRAGRVAARRGRADDGADQHRPGRGVHVRRRVRAPRRRGGRGDARQARLAGGRDVPRPRRAGAVETAWSKSPTSARSRTTRLPRSSARWTRWPAWTPSAATPSSSTSNRTR